MAFGLKYWAELRSKYKDVLWRVEIAERGYAGAAEEMFFDGGTPLSITWEKRGDEFHVPVKASEATINILCRENFHYLSLFTSDPRQFRVSIFRNSQLYWRGYVVADLYSENFTAPPYQVSIKAVDGFNLLSSIPFRDLLGLGITGRRSLWELLAACIDLLELDVDIADWMDLYAEGMDESQSPLRQTFIDLERLFYVYEDSACRDVLELCLRPFAGQIFQSNGALHIRRAVSLYQTSRPMSFYRVGTEYPLGRIITGGGLRLVAHRGCAVITSAARERMDAMWDGDLHVLGESVLDIAPALRKVTVGVKNKSLSNLIDYLGFYDIDSWHDPHGFITMRSATELHFAGHDDYQGEEIRTKGFRVAQCNYPLTLEYTLQSNHGEWGVGWRRPDANYVVKIHYGVRIVNAKGAWYLASTGVWLQGDGEIVNEAKVNEEINVKINVQGIPADGEWVFFFRQTLVGKVYSYPGGGRTSGHLEGCAFRKMTLTIDVGDTYDKGLQTESLVNPANNIDMSVQLPICDIPAIPNDHLLYALYFLDAWGNATHIWHTKGCNDYETLVGHIVQTALRYKQLPSRRITGELFSGLHIDMNTVVRDDKYLRAGYYVNSIELKALDDSCNCELVEMPNLLSVSRPPEGDDCVAAAELPFTVVKAIRCLNLLLLRSADNRVYAFDLATAKVREIYRATCAFEIYPADEGFVTVDGQTLRRHDYRGVVKQVLEMEYNAPATYMDGYFYILKFARYSSGPRSTRATSYTFHYLNRPEFKYAEQDEWPRRGTGQTGTTILGDICSLMRTANTIVINTSREAYLHDKRFQKPCITQILEPGTQIVTISDNFMGVNLDGHLLIYRRDSITERTLIHRTGRRADFADHTMSEFAQSGGGDISVWNFRDNTSRGVQNNAGREQPIRGLFYIYGELHIVRERTIYKYIP